LPTASTISNYTITPTQDFNYLRQKGLEYIQQLSGGLWTDHNLHDPGITILEVLCYALMDLGYRSNFSMKDLLTESDGKIDKEAFHTARKIFTTCPITINDYRKLLMDIPGVRNAWLFATDTNGNAFEEGINLYAYCKESRLLHEQDIATINVNDQPHVRQEEKITINGLYQVKLELDEHPIYGDLNSSVVQLKIAAGTLAGYQLEIKFPFWNKKDRLSRELISLFTTEKLDAVKAMVVNDTLLNAAKFGEVKRSQFAIRFTINYGTNERLLDTIIKVIKAPTVANGLVKASALQKGFDERNFALTAEAIKRYRQRPTEIFKTFDKARKMLMQHRNLCEDFLFQIGTVDTEELTLCMDIDVDSNTDLEAITAQIFSLVENYLLPPVQFSTLQQLMNAGVPVEEIFDGPALQHGFLTNEAIEKANIRQTYYSSDIVGLLMGIKGVVNVSNFLFTIYDASGNKKSAVNSNWQINVSPNHKLKLSRERCKFLFYKKGLPMTANFNESINKLRLTQALQKSLKYKNPENDLPIPVGKYRSLDKYETILNEFPRVYGLGDKKLPDTVTEERQAQVKQLEGYLSFFDQLLAQFFSQLNGVKNLLSAKEGQPQTYISQYVYTDEKAAQLYENAAFLKNPIDNILLEEQGEANTVLNQPRRTFLKTQTGLQSITETYSDYLDRRNRLLDHLISRFAENFNNYAINLYALPDEMVLSDEAAGEKLIQDKLALIKNYPLISSDRSGAYNYAAAEPADTDNISGYARRMRSLLGMELKQNVSLKDLPEDDWGGFHLVEHILLRPVAAGNPLLSVCLQENCDHCGEEDPYSFRLSIVLPYWMKRFRSMNFRNYMESLFRSEAPAHIFLKICWVDKEEMAAFEEAYIGWLMAKATYTKALPIVNETTQTTYAEALKKLIEKMENLRTDFPAATLHDCTDKDEENDTRVFLGHTALGTFTNITEDDPE
jgi:hypothetical protein